jgi:hypothetical protein
MPSLILDIADLLGYLLRAIGFLVIGLALGRFLLEAYKKGTWPVQIALALGFFGLLIALTDFASAGSAGAFALGAGISMLNSNSLKQLEQKADEEPNQPQGQM